MISTRWHLLPNIEVLSIFLGVLKILSIRKRIRRQQQSVNFDSLLPHPHSIVDDYYKKQSLYCLEPTAN